MTPTMQMAIGLGVGLILLVAVWPVLVLKFYAGKAGFRVELKRLIGMRLRLESMALLRKVVWAGARGVDLGVGLDRIETAALAGADFDRCLDAMDEARRRDRPTSWDAVLVCDLAGRDALAIVKAGVDPGRVVGAAEFAGRFGKMGE